MRIHLVPLGLNVCMKCGMTVLNPEAKARDEIEWSKAENNCEKIHAPYKPAVPLSTGGKY